MDIRLDCGIWYANGYAIDGDRESGYSIYKEEEFEKRDDPERLEECSDFEEAITWVYNS